MRSYGRRRRPGGWVPESQSAEPARGCAASQVAVEASKVDWAGLAEGALEQTVVFLVYVPVFAYTFAASLPAEEQFVLGLVVLLVVGSFAKQDD